MGQEEEAEKRRSDLADYRIDGDLVAARRGRRHRPALPAGALRRGDHGGRALRASVGCVGSGREPAARTEGADGVDDPLVLPLKDNVPTRHFPLVTLLLVAVNVAVWILYQLPDLEGSARELAYQPCEVTDTCPRGTAAGEDWPVTAVTSMFMHGGWLHLIGNMLFLWVFGNNVEDAMGKVRFLALLLRRGVRRDGAADDRHPLDHFGCRHGYSEPRRQRGRIGRARRLSAAPADGASADDRRLLPDRGAGLLLPGVLVPFSALVGRALADPAAGRRRRGLLRARRRLRLRDGDGASVRRRKATAAPLY